MPYYVYVLQNSVSGRFYVGQTNDVSRRLQEHNDKESDWKSYTRKQRGS